MKYTLEILKVEIVCIPGHTDAVYVTTKLPSPFDLSISDPSLVLKFDAPIGTGAEYVRKHFGVEPRVVKVG